MKNMEEWIDTVLEKTLPENVVAIAFNLYEDGDAQWSIEMVGTNRFDPEDPDWACDEVFDTRDDLQSWVQKAGWEEILRETTDKIRNYIEPKSRIISTQNVRTLEPPACQEIVGPAQ